MKLSKINANLTTIIKLVIVTLTIVIMSSCSSSKKSEFVVAHPEFSNSYFNSTDIYLQEITSDNFFTLITYRLSRDFEIDRAQLIDYLNPKFNQWFIAGAGISNSKIKNFNLNEIKSQLIEENTQIDEKVFITSHLPFQGHVLEFNSTEPNVVLFINEVTLGANLKPEFLYDYEVSARDDRPEVDADEKALSLLTSYTLWDNKRQRILQAGIISQDISMPDKITDMHLKALVDKTTAKLSKSLELKK